MSGSESDPPAANAEPLPLPRMNLRFAHLPPGDRWEALDRELAELVSRLTIQTIDPAAEINLSSLAEEHGCTVAAMRRSLVELGAHPYRIGKAWRVRRATYAAAIVRAEARASAEDSSKSVL